MTIVSLGPYSASMPTLPNTSRLAIVTKMLPGPTILSTRGIVSVPYASAAIASAPPARNTRSTPAISAATSFSGATTPSSPAGLIITSSLTPATFAGIAVISTDDGYTAPGDVGTYMPTRSTARTCMPTPSRLNERDECSRCSS